MNDTDDNTTDSNKSEHQFEVKKAGKVKPSARAGKNFTPNKTEQQYSPPQSIVTGENLPSQVDYSCLKLEAIPIKGLKLFAKSIGLLIFSLFLWDVYDTIAMAMSFHWLAALGFVTLSILVAVLLFITFYKYRKDQLRQRAYKTIRRLAERCRSASSNKNDQLLISELKLFYVGKPQQILLDQCLCSLPDYALGQEVVAHINDTFIKPLDAEALTRVSRFSSQSALTVALSPWVTVDMLLSIWRNIKMIDEIGQVYGIRPSLANRISMLKSVISHLALSGASELVADYALDEVGGASLASHFSFRLSQGLGVGLYTAKIGLATMDVSRPMEFIENKPDLKSLKRPLIEQLKKRFKPKLNRADRA